MAYRRKQGTSRVSTFKDEIRNPTPDDSSSYYSSPSLAAQAIRASSAHRDSSLSSAYGESAFTSSYRDSNQQTSFPARQDSTSYKYTSMKSLNESKYGFWGVMARKAKSILEDDNVVQQFDKPVGTRPQMLDSQTGGEFHQSYRSPGSGRKTDSPSLQKGFNAITSSLNYIGSTIGNALEDGLTIVENKTADIIQETRKLNIRKKGSDSDAKTQATDVCSPHQQSCIHTDQETQLKASRDVAMAMAAKAKLLIRELKTIKADLAFAKERCSQLEEENRILRENRDKGDSPEDDDLIRLQLETLLAEKARLAQENSTYARENRFLREIVEYHQLTMQDVIYLDEGIEEVTEVCPISISASTDKCAIPTPPPLEVPPTPSPEVAKDISVPPTPPSPVTEGSHNVVSSGSSVPIPQAKDPE